MVFGELCGRPVGVQDARIGDQFHARRLRGIDHRPMLLDAARQLVRRHEQEPIHPRKRRGQGLGAVVVGFADRDAPGGKVGRLPRRANRSDDVAGIDGVQQPFDDETAELSGGSGDSVDGSS